MESSYNITEPDRVEIGVQLIGSLSFPVDVEVQVNFTTSSGNAHSLDTQVVMLSSFLASDSDFTVESFNILTFTGAITQSVNISVVDDDLVEPPEVIQLTLIPLTLTRIVTNLKSTTIEIFDNDGEITNHQSFLSHDYD